VRAEEHHQAACHLDQVREEHDLALWHGVSECADEGREDHVEKGEHGHERRPLPFWLP
jgi:hypothetical protein